MKSASIATLETELAKVLDWVEHGEEVVLLRGETPVARVLPIDQPAQSSSAKPRTSEEIERYLREKPAPRGPVSTLTGAELVSIGRGEI